MSNIKSIRKRKITTETLWNLAVEKDESYVSDGVVVHNCRSTLVAITKYEEFKPDRVVETIDEEGNFVDQDINAFIKENLGKGFSVK